MELFKIGDVVEITRQAQCRPGIGVVVGLVEPFHTPTPELLDLYSPFNREIAVKPMPHKRFFVTRKDSGITVVFPSCLTQGLRLVR